MSVPHSLLALLSDGPAFGLRLKEEFERRTGTVWPLNVGQVYTTLQRLERDGLIVPDDAEATPGTKRYGITDAGRRELDHWLHTPPANAAPPRNEVVIKVMVALSVAEFDVPAIIQSHRRHALESMQVFARMKAAATDDLAVTLVADSELFRLEATVRWLDACQARLQRGDRLNVEPLDAEPALPGSPSQRLQREVDVSGAGAPAEAEGSRARGLRRRRS